jgi:hypothetical protein
MSAKGFTNYYISYSSQDSYKDVRACSYMYGRTHEMLQWRRKDSIIFLKNIIILVINYTGHWGLGFMDVRVMNTCLLAKWIEKLERGENSVCCSMLRRAMPRYTFYFPRRNISNKSELLIF